MAPTKLCSVDGCGKKVVAKGYCATHYRKFCNHKPCTVGGCDRVETLHRGMCGMHYARWRTHGDPNKVIAPKDIARPWLKRPKKYDVDGEWLRRVYSVERRPVGEIAAEIGCHREHLKHLVARHGIPRRDGRGGVPRLSRRVDVDIEKAKALYLGKKWPTDRIGDALGCHGATVLRALKRAGVPIRHHNDTKRGAKARNRIELDPGKVVAAYRKKWASAASVAKVFGVSSGVICRILDEAGEPRKPAGETRDFSGENSPRWRADLSPREREMRRDYNAQASWRVLVFERDDYTCQKCGDDSGGNLTAHHIEPHYRAKALRWELSNGVTLCDECHRAFHRRYGFKKANRAALDEYLGDADGGLCSNGEQVCQRHEGSL